MKISKERTMLNENIGKSLIEKDRTPENSKRKKTTTTEITTHPTALTIFEEKSKYFFPAKLISRISASKITVVKILLDNAAISIIKPAIAPITSICLKVIERNANKTIVGTTDR